MRMRCYCCGEELNGLFTLCAYQDDADRVFVFKPEHVAKIDAEVYTQNVMRAGTIPHLAGYAVQMADGQFVGIWREREIADKMQAKQPPSHKDRVVPLYEIA